jgi:mannose-6-phosphate isomerase-like protein (cupin superfamily)
MIRLFGMFSILTFASAFLSFVMAAASQGVTSGPPKKSTPGQSPSAPAQKYVVKTSQSIEETIKELQSGNKTSNLITGDSIGCRVFIQHEMDISTNQAEVHDGADDIFIVMEGTATLTLGGKLDSPSQVQPGEWRASSITGGTEFRLNKGDVAIVPRGTPHRRSTARQEVTLMVVKVTTAPAK